jgi:hypothetical protein
MLLNLDLERKISRKSRNSELEIQKTHLFTLLKLLIIRLSKKKTQKIPTTREINSNYA